MLFFFLLVLEIEFRILCFVGMFFCIELCFIDYLVLYFLFLDRFSLSYIGWLLVGEYSLVLE